MPDTFVLLEIADRIARVTLNRPEKRNALNAEVIERLFGVFEEIRKRDDVGVVLLSGAGDKAFVAGADIGELAQLDVERARAVAVRGQRLTRLMETLGKPVIAVIQGWAVGGGCELALACTLRIASENAMLGQPEVKLGIIPGYGGSQRLPRLVGSGRALEMILTGEPIDAREAHRIGLVNKVVPADRLSAEAEALAKKILVMGPRAVEYSLEAVDRGMSLPLEGALGVESELFGRCFGTADMKEGTSAFLEKRAPRFTGR